MITVLRRFSLPLGAALAIAVLGAAYVSVTATGKPVRPHAKAAVTTSVGTYSVFTMARAAGDDISSWKLPEAAQEQLGIDRTRSHLIFRDSSRSVAVVPTNEGPCIVQQFKDGAGGVACGGGGNPPVVLGYDGAIGLVPDSVKTVTYTLSDGSTQLGTVTGNAWHSPVEAAKVTYAIEGGRRSFELMPRSSLPKGATISESGMVSAGPLADG
jgi:hypothetical protein